MPHASFALSAMDRLCGGGGGGGCCCLARLANHTLSAVRLCVLVCVGVRMDMSSVGVRARARARAVVGVGVGVRDVCWQGDRW